MKILQMVNALPDRNTGMVGTTMETGDAMVAEGAEVDYVWREAPPSRWGQNLSRFIEVPQMQLSQARAALARTAYDVVIVHQPHGYPVMQKLAPLHPKCLFLHYSHGWELCAPSYTPESPTLTRRLKDAVTLTLLRRDCNRMARLAQGHVVLNRADAEYMIQRNGIAPAKVCVLPLGLNPTLLNSPARVAAPAGTPAHFLFAGNYVPQKGCSIMEAALLELAKENKVFTFTCITHNDQHEGLRQRLGPALGGRLTLLGWQKREALLDHYRSHDFLLFPSRYEGFGKVAHEAMASGLAVVGSNVGVLTDRGVHGENALLSSAGDTKGFLANLRQAATHPELANIFGPRARTAVMGDSWKVTGKSLLHFIEQLQARQK